MPDTRFSLEGKLALAMAAGLCLSVALALVLEHVLGAWWLALLLALTAGLLVALGLLHWLMMPVNHLVQALTDGVANLRDNDFSISIANTRRDELGQLIDAYNTLGDILRAERTNILQRELLLDTVIQTTPLALVLTDSEDRIIVANAAARALFHDGRRVAGFRFADLLAQAPPAFGQAVTRGTDGLFSVDTEDAADDETFYLTTSRFDLNARPHVLHLFKRVTREMSRQEVATWKKVIRVIAHELNNSLAPISSLANSGKIVAHRQDPARLDTIFSTIEERARHLKSFIEGYARFAKLPQPRVEPVHWPLFVERLGGTVPFVVVGELPGTKAHFDTAQLEQALINLLKNAHESDSPTDEVTLSVTQGADEWVVSVRDRGTGMSPQVLQSAMLPFYSTKRSGTGLGLTLAREIVDAHGGSMSIANRADGGLAIDLRLPRQALPGRA